jgi:hypothetical protein
MFIVYEHTYFDGPTDRQTDRQTDEANTEFSRDTKEEEINH